jgi:Ion transport protein
MSLVIVINTALLALDAYPPNYDLMSRVEKANLACSLIFFSEMIIKLIGFGFKGYLGDPMNLFHTFIVLSSIVDIGIAYMSGRSLGGSAVTAIRAVRLIRVFKLAKTWKKFRFLIKTMVKTAKDVATFSILLVLFVFTYTLLGLELFGHRAKFDASGNVDPNGQSQVYNFDNFLNAFSTVFIIMTNDSWQGMYYSHFRAAGGVSSTLFFLSLVIIGQKVFLNLFLAILLENFDESTLKQQILD